MRTSVGNLRKLVREARVAASPAYMRKERVRERLQSMIVSAVSSGEVRDQESLDELVKALEMSVTALRMVPFEAWNRMARDS